VKSTVPKPQNQILLMLIAVLALGVPAHGQTQLVVSPTSLNLVINPSFSTTFTQVQSLTITTSDGSAIPYSVSLQAVSPPGPWLLTAPVSNGPQLTPASVGIYAQAIPPIPGVTTGLGSAGLPLPFNGTISVTSSAASTVVIPVVVTQLGSPEPSAMQGKVDAVLNAASFQENSMSPGEIISIFGTGIGPAVPAGAAYDSSGRALATSVSGVSVYFYNHPPTGSCCEYAVPAPLTYVSATQINCVVPYEITQMSGQLYIDVNYLGAWSSSAISPLKTASFAPGIFTSGSGTGQAAVLNSDSTPNGVSNPASAGSVIAVYMTGEGQTSPPGITGSVTCAGGCASTNQIPTTEAPVTAFIEGLPATVGFYGEAPDLVAGVMQVNVTIPSYIQPSIVPLSIKIGGVSTQSGVTIAVK